MPAVLGSAVYELKADQTGLMRGIDKAGKDSRKKLQAIGKNMSVAVTAPYPRHRCSRVRGLRGDRPRDAHHLSRHRRDWP